MSDQITQTFGQRAVGLNFNPSGDLNVEDCKQAFAREIDRMNIIRQDATRDSQLAPASSERARLASIAITELQAAQMWAVKAITWRD
jgi:hypothetical protein